MHIIPVKVLFNGFAILFKIVFMHSRNTLLMMANIVNSNDLKIDVEVSNMSSQFVYDEDIKRG